MRWREKTRGWMIGCVFWCQVDFEEIYTAVVRVSWWWWGKLLEECTRSGWGVVRKTNGSYENIYRTCWVFQELLYAQPQKR